ncbi:MAG TPA: Ig-like domain-containing protein, partial [Terracidiphilus sp.]
MIAGLGLLAAGCGSNTDVSTIQITPATQSLAAGQTAQFSATGIIHHGKHPSSTQDVTTMVTWASNAPAIATISSTGVATAVSAGTATLTASLPGSISASATMTVTGGSVSPNNDIVSLSLIPGSQSVALPNESSQFIAIGSNAAGSTVNVTGQVAWSSSSTSVATINSAGLATGVGKGTATITAILTNSDKTVASATSTFTVLSGASEPITALTITPGTQSLSASGQTGQFIAIGTSGSTGLSEDLTNSPQLKWTSSIPTVASVSSGQASGNGVVTGVSVGTATISAVWTNPDNTVVSATASVSVALTAPPNPLLSLTIIPEKISVGDLQDTGQFLAIGTFSSPPYVRDVTNSPNTIWISSFPDYFPVNTNSGGTSSASAGIVTAYASGSTTIIAEYTDPATQTIQTATATFSCPLQLPDPTTHPPTPGSCWTGQTGPLKATLTVYGEGLNTTNWEVTAPSATGTPDVIHCGPGWAADGNAGGSVCVGIYPIGQTVLLTAPARAGVGFGGWTYNCTPSDDKGNPLPGPIFWTAAGPNYCTIPLGATNAT